MLVPVAHLRTLCGEQQSQKTPSQLPHPAKQCRKRGEKKPGFNASRFERNIFVIESAEIGALGTQQYMQIDRRIFETSGRRLLLFHLSSLPRRTVLDRHARYGKIPMILDHRPTKRGRTLFAKRNAPRQGPPIRYWTKAQLALLPALTKYLRRRSAPVSLPLRRSAGNRFTARLGPLPRPGTSWQGPGLETAGPCHTCPK